MKRYVIFTFIMVLVFLPACSFSSDEVLSFQLTNEGGKNVLPRNLFYIKQDYKSGLDQIYKLSRDARYDQQITYEEKPIIYYDISPMTEDIVFIIEDDLIIQKLDKTRIIIDNNLPLSYISQERKINENGELVNILEEREIIPSYFIKPIWSPNGKNIAYINNGIQLYSIDSQNSNLVLPITNDKKEFIPISFSPDSKKLLIRSNIEEKDVFRNLYILFLDDNSIVPLLRSRINGPETTDIGYLNWSIDSDYILLSAFFLGGSGEGMMVPGLWRFDLQGMMETLIKSEYSPNNKVSRQVISPFQNENDTIFFLYAERREFTEKVIPYKLAKISHENNYNIVIVRDDVIYPSSNGNDNLWSIEGNYVILENYSNNMREIILLSIDKNIPQIKIISDSSTIRNHKWGK
jgi:WD40 repeat protein